MRTLSETWDIIRTNHRGPYRLVVDRTKVSPAAKQPYRCEWLPGEVGADDVPEEAEALLTDPRDRIVRVAVWSATEGCFVGTLRA